MFKTLEDMQKFGKGNVEAALRSFDVYARNVQTIAQEVADYSKRSVDEGSRAVEQLFGASTVESAIEVQKSYLRNTYDGFVSQASKLGSLYADLARETYKPFEEQVARATAR